MIAHVAGAPIEELLPLLASGGVTMVVALRAALGNARRGRRGRRAATSTRRGPVPGSDP